MGKVFRTVKDVDGLKMFIEMCRWLGFPSRIMHRNELFGYVYPDNTSA